MELIIPFTDTILDTKTYTRRINTDIACVINFPDCPCVEPYCAKYKIPFVETDLFQFYVSNKTSSAVAINLADDTIISPNPVSFLGTKITVDFSLLPPEIICFYVKYTSNSIDYCFEFSFERTVENETQCNPNQYDCGIPSLLMTSRYNNSDCLGNRYVNGYENTIRIYGIVYFNGITPNTEETEKKKIISRMIQENWKLRNGGFIPDNSWLVSHITKSIFMGSDLTINNQIFLLDGGIDKPKDDIPFWFLEINLKTEVCLINYSCDT